jgi:hypothetical protein
MSAKRERSIIGIASEPKENLRQLDCSPGGLVDLLGVEARGEALKISRFALLAGETPAVPANPLNRIPRQR